MSLVRLLPAWLHAVADYAVGLSLIIVAVAAGGAGKAVAPGVVVGAVVLVVSMLTKYPLGVAKVLPFTVHSAGDYLAAALLIVSPFALNFNDTDDRPHGLLHRRRHRGARGEPDHQLPVQRQARVEPDAGRHRLSSRPQSSIPHRAPASMPGPGARSRSRVPRDVAPLAEHREHHHEEPAASSSITTEPTPAIVTCVQFKP